MKKIFLSIALAAGTVCAAWAGDPYKVQMPTTDDDEGAMAFLVNYDTGENIDSVLVADHMALFRGETDDPFVARITIDGARRGQLIVENGSIVIDPQRRIAFGSPLNDAYNALGDSAATYQDAYQQATTEEAKQAVIDRYVDFTNRAMKENLSNPIGYLLFIEQAYEMEPAELEEYLKKEPSLASYQRIAKLVEMNRRKSSTGVGAKYADFDVRGEKLSDWVGRDGKYLLVDFWASWCGPCMRQLPVLKELYTQYGDRLNVLGVAVWDKAEDTEKAIKSHELSWHCIIDAGNIPTDVYGISAIPCIMLIGPDGTILSRDKQGDALRADVAKYLEQ